MAGPAHTLQQLDAVGRTARCAVDGPVRVKLSDAMGTLHCVVELRRPGGPTLAARSRTPTDWPEA